MGRARSARLSVESLEARSLLSSVAGRATSPLAGNHDATALMPSMTIGLSSLSDPGDDGAVSQARATLAGHASPGSSIRLFRGGMDTPMARATAGARGDFQLALPLRPGENALHIVATSS